VGLERVSKERARAESARGKARTPGAPPNPAQQVEGVGARMTRSSGSTLPQAPALPRDRAGPEPAHLIAPFLGSWKGQLFRSRAHCCRLEPAQQGNPGPLGEPAPATWGRVGDSWRGQAGPGLGARGGSSCPPPPPSLFPGTLLLFYFRTY
jgi:hypothetical protein